MFFCKEACRDPDNRLASSLIERITLYQENMSSNPGGTELSNLTNGVCFYITYYFGDGSMSYVFHYVPVDVIDFTTICRLKIFSFWLKQYYGVFCMVSCDLRQTLWSWAELQNVYWSQIHERTILLRFLGIILTVFRLEVSVFNVYITNQFHTTFARGGGGGGW